MLMSIGRTARVLSASLAFTALLTAAAGAQSNGIIRERIRPAFPEINFAERQLSGQAAVDRLGANLPSVASWYGKSADALRNQLLSDRRVRIDSKGRMFVVEEMTTPLAGSTAETQQSLMQGQLSSLDQTFLMHSRPGAQKTIYLDFTGASITGTAWNSNGNTLNAKPFDIDGNPSAFSATELQRIQYIWQRVAEDYAPFDVDVTTEAPTQDRISRSDSNDQVYGTTVVITDNNGVYNCTCGGIAYVGIFNDTSDYRKPALVFYNMLGPADEKAVAEAISHEAGHNMGLSHDGTSGTNGTAYYGGQGTDALTAWAPIMGVGYYKPLVQFSKGEYSGANNTEDDFAVMQGNGLPLRGDDFGNSIYAATPLPGTNGGTIDGVIERAGDADVFSFTANAGSFNASVIPANRSANADLVLTLINAAGSELASSNPINALNASISYQLPAAGTYYVRVSATGQGDPATDGYSAYGSVGNYRVSANFQAGGTPPIPVLTASATSAVAPAAITFDASQSTDPDGTVKFYYWDFGDGTGDTSGSLQTASKTYTVPGNYVVRLTVVDDKGYSASTAQTVSIADAALIKTVSVRDLNLSLVVSRTGVARARGQVVVVNQLGQVMRRATISATWTGVVSSSQSRRSSIRGSAIFTSAGTKLAGCYTFTITNISLTGYSVNAGSLPSQEICR